MGPETSGVKSPDCPYPAFDEISIEDIQNGTVLIFDTITNYLAYVATCEKLPATCSTLHPSLCIACTTIRKLLNKRFPLHNPWHFTPIHTLESPKYIQSEFVVNYYTKEGLPELDISRYEAIALWHGGLTGINFAHLEILSQLALSCLGRNRLIIMGIERNEYLETKNRETLRPWPLIVTFSIYAYLAAIYKIPLKLFLMPPPPTDPLKYNAHYDAIYYLLHQQNSKTTIVTTPADPYIGRKYRVMNRVGLTPDDWQWTNLPFSTHSPSTGTLLGERDTAYQNLLPSFNLFRPNYPILDGLTQSWQTLSLCS